MEATVRSVLENGLENTTARTIGSLSGVNEVYIYRYFKNKDDLIAKTFDYADEKFLEHILESFPVMKYDSVDYDMRCRLLFTKCWDYIMANPDWLMFYVGYYYSKSFQIYSYDDHMKRYEVLISKMKPACHKNADVTTVLHHILNTLLGQAKNQITHPKDINQVTDDTFHLVLSVIKGGKYGLD